METNPKTPAPNSSAPTPAPSHADLQPKTRTITLTDRAPVRIVESDWPIVASAKRSPGAFRNGTPVPDYEHDTYSLRVRQHADGRAIVYAVVTGATAWTGTHDAKGGELVLPLAGDSLVDAILRVAKSVIPHRADGMAQECIAALPAVDL